MTQTFKTISELIALLESWGINLKSLVLKGKGSRLVLYPTKSISMFGLKPDTFTIFLNKSNNIDLLHQIVMLWHIAYTKELENLLDNNNEVIGQL